jgi:hypothetical protein
MKSREIAHEVASCRPSTARGQGFWIEEDGLVRWGEMAGPDAMKTTLF